jgi:hypothetical protein
VTLVDGTGIAPVFSIWASPLARRGESKQREGQHMSSNADEGQSQTCDEPEEDVPIELLTRIGALATVVSDVMESGGHSPALTMMARAVAVSTALTVWLARARR